MGSSKAIAPARQLILAGVFVFVVPAVFANTPATRDELKVTMRVLDPDATDPGQIVRKIPPPKSKQPGKAEDSRTDDLANPSGNNEPGEPDPDVPADPGAPADPGGGQGPGQGPDPRDRGEEFGDRVSDDGRNHGEEVRRHEDRDHDRGHDRDDDRGHDRDDDRGRDRDDRGPPHEPRRPKPHD